MRLHTAIFGPFSARLAAIPFAPDLLADAGDAHLLADCGPPPPGWGPWLCALLAALTLVMAAEVAFGADADEMIRTGRSANPVRVRAGAGRSGRAGRVRVRGARARRDDARERAA